MHDYAAAVLTTLEEVAPDDLAYVRAQLSDDYDPLFTSRTDDSQRHRVIELPVPSASTSRLARRGARAGCPGPTMTSVIGDC